MEPLWMRSCWQQAALGMVRESVRGRVSLHRASHAPIRARNFHLALRCGVSRLPSGLRIRHVSKPDVPFLYREVFEEQAYARHGVRLGPGDSVLDVGANIGMFALWAAERVAPGGRVVALEPLPPIYDALLHNISAHREWCQRTGAPPAGL
jgi:2-polyprenyl-3-methyl-5-hydroxy-6-metoxy-1,4-benzoquinol methylase